jgi:hypothetical protein
LSTGSGADKRLQFYVAPLGPFLDPGSRAYEHADRLGFHRRFTTLAEHRDALLGPTWHDMLAYHTDWMTRDEIVHTTYEVGRQLNDLKREAGLIDAATHDAVAAHLRTAVWVMAEIDALGALPEPERRERLARLRADSSSANRSSLAGEDELTWKATTGIRVTRLLVRNLAVALVRELGHTLARARGRYDTAITDAAITGAAGTEAQLAGQVQSRISGMSSPYSRT